MKIIKPGLYQFIDCYKGIPKGCFLKVTKVYRSGSIDTTLFNDLTDGIMPVQLIKEFENG